MLASKGDPFDKLTLRCPFILESAAIFVFLVLFRPEERNASQMCLLLWAKKELLRILDFVTMRAPLGNVFLFFVSDGDQFKKGSLVSSHSGSRSDRQKRNRTFFGFLGKTCRVLSKEVRYHVPNIRAPTWICLFVLEAMGKESVDKGASFRNPFLVRKRIVNSISQVFVSLSFYSNRQALFSIFGKFVFLKQKVRYHPKCAPTWICFFPFESNGESVSKEKGPLHPYSNCGGNSDFSTEQAVGGNTTSTRSSYRVLLTHTNSVCVGFDLFPKRAPHLDMSLGFDLHAMGNRQFSLVFCLEEQPGARRAARGSGKRELSWKKEPCPVSSNVR
jgi:hypothetical protein